MRNWWFLGLVLLLSCGGKHDLEFADGSTGSFSDWHGRWVLINYWAEWCAPCRKEIPELNALDRQHGDVVVFGVNYDGVQGEKLTSLIETMGIEFPVLVTDPRLHWNQDQPSVLPTTLVINPDGELEEVLVGPQTLVTLIGAVANRPAEGS